ncbi:MAG: choice-of-anchor J domain-containing protein [Prevotella sp.]|nr:choice-of-anchor J domain-containing protein [Prevotella sp.]
MKKRKLWMLTAILTISGLTLQAQEQDFSTKQAAPKAKVFNFKGSQTANPVSSVKPIEKVRKPGIAFRDARTATSMSLDGKSPVKAPVQPQDGRQAKRPSHVSVGLPMKASKANGEVVDAHGIIVSPAQGERKVYERSGMRYDNEDQLVTMEQSGSVHIVTCDDGTVYIRNILSNYPTGAWVKGMRKGNTISVPVHQPIEYNASAEVTLSLQWAVVDEFGGFSNYDGYNNGRFTFAVDDVEGTISLEKSSENCFMGLFWDDYDSFAWQGDYETVWTYTGGYQPLESVTVTPPDGLQTETWHVKGHVQEGEEQHLYKGNVTIGFQDDFVYLKGLFPDYPEAWMKGKIDGMDVSFEGLQTQGTNGDATVYAVGCEGGDLTDFRMLYDSDTQTMTSTRNLLANADPEEVRAEMWFNDIALSKYDPFAPIEVLPYANGFDSVDDWDWLTIIDANGDGSTWHQFEDEASYKYNSDNDADDWLISPAIRLEAGKTYSFTIDAHCSTDAYDERMEVKMGAAATAEAMTIMVIEPTELQTEMPLTLANKFITVPETGYYHFGIHAISDYDHASLRVDNLLVDETIMAAPAAVSDLTVTADPEKPMATITFTAPTKNIGGEDLTDNLTKIELLRDNEVITTFEDVAPGTALTYVDDNPELEGATYRYQVVAYNADGQGDKSDVVSVRLNYVYDIPYIADFTQDAVGDQFMQIDANDDDRRWEWDGGTHATYEYSSSQPADDYLVSPPLHFDAGKRYAITVNAGSAGYPERFEIVVGREATVEGLNVKVLEDCVVTDEDEKDFEAVFTADETGSYHVAVHCISDADMYELWINKVIVDFAPEPTAPAAPELAVTPGALGAKSADIVVKAPTTSVDGNALTANLTKIELYRGSDLVDAFEDVAPGATLNHTDNIEEAGEYTYQAVPYNADGIGLKSEKVTVYLGPDTPEYVKNVKAVDQQTSVMLTWDKVTETGHNGGYVNLAEVEYVIYACLPGTTIPDEEVASVTDADSYVLDFTTNEGEQGYQVWYVAARNEVGESLLYDESGARLLVGSPYDLPVVEGFAEGNLHYFWESNSLGLNFSQSSDDDGMAIAMTAQEAGNIYLNSGKLNIKEATNPTLLFDAVGFGVGRVNVTGHVDGGDEVALATESLNENGYKSVKVPLNELKTGNFAQVGLMAAIKNPTIIDDWGEIEEQGDALVVDNIRIVDLLAHNLTVGLSAPTAVDAGKNAEITVTVTNWGEQAAKDYTLIVTVGDEMLMQETIGSELAPFATKEFTASWATSVFDEAGDRTIKVQADYGADLKPADNTAEATITINDSKAPAPENLTAEDKGATGVELNWNAPAAEPAEHTESFDNTDAFPTFSIGGITATEHAGRIGEWTLFDGNGSEVYSWQDPSISYENRYVPSAWMVFDIAKAGFAKEVGHSGTQVMLSMCPVPDGDVDAADHWLISPELPGTEQEISFYLRAITDRYGIESFEVLASKTDNQPESFELVESFATDEMAWTPYNVMLPEGTKYFAIRHTSNDIFGVMVDDVRFNYVGAVSKYNVYYERQLVATVENGVTTYTIAADQVEDGEHTFAVTAVYASGQESKPVSVSIMVASGIRQVIAGGQPVDIFTIDGKLVRSQAKSLDGLKGVYVVGGQKVIIR